MKTILYSSWIKEYEKAFKKHYLSGGDIDITVDVVDLVDMEKIIKEIEED